MAPRRLIVQCAATEAAEFTAVLGSLGLDWPATPTT